MSADFLGYLETEVAMALRAIDRAAMLAKYLEDHPPVLTPVQSGRLEDGVRRILAIRQAIEANVQLPPLRSIEELQAESYPVDGESLTIGQIAAGARIHRTTVIRWILSTGGAIARKYARARRAGKPARFTLEEAETILKEGGIGHLEEPGRSTASLEKNES